MSRLIKGTGTANGKVSVYVDIPRDAKEVDVKLTAYSETHGLVFVKAPFVERDFLTSALGPAGEGSSIRHKLKSDAISKTYVLEFVYADDTAVDMTDVGVAEFAIWLEFR